MTRRPDIRPNLYEGRQFLLRLATHFRRCRCFFAVQYLRGDLVGVFPTGVPLNGPPLFVPECSRHALARRHHHTLDERPGNERSPLISAHPPATTAIADSGRSRSRVRRIRPRMRRIPPGPWTRMQARSSACVVDRSFRPPRPTTTPRTSRRLRRGILGADIPSREL
jgi:hypothetical protein